MRLIGVIDLMAGQAVHARGGLREAYKPLRSPLLSPDQVGDAVALARAYRAVRGQAEMAEIYVADLTAIGGAGGANATSDYSGIADAGLPIMVDAGVTTAAGAERVLAAGATRVVVGLETLGSFDDLAAIVQQVGAGRVVFSLDMRDRDVVTRPDAPFSRARPLELAGQAAMAGAPAILLLDLGRVGRAAGVDLDLVREVRAEVAHLELLVGGGVRDSSDIELLAAAGCDAVLVGTALHSGTLRKTREPESD